jgi:hypothetical protein
LRAIRSQPRRELLRILGRCRTEDVGDGRAAHRDRARRVGGRREQERVGGRGWVERGERAEEGVEAALRRGVDGGRRRGDDALRAGEEAVAQGGAVVEREQDAGVAGRRRGLVAGVDGGVEGRVAEAVGGGDDHRGAVVEPPGARQEPREERAGEGSPRVARERLEAGPGRDVADEAVGGGRRGWRCRGRGRRGVRPSWGRGGGEEEVAR